VIRYIKTYEQYFGSKPKTGQIIYMTDDLVNNMARAHGNKYAAAVLNLLKADRDKLIDNHANYLSVETDGTISYLDGRYLKEETEYNPANYDDARRRQKVKATKILQKILKPEYIPQEQTVIEQFSTYWKTLYDESTRVEELVGEDILRAYNYNNEVNGSLGSCAGFSEYTVKETHKKRFEVLIKNPENFTAFVVWKDGKIVGRRIGVKGIQTKTHGFFQEGELYKYLNNFYGPGYGSQANKMIEALALKQGYVAEYGSYCKCFLKDKKKLREEDVFRIKVQNGLDQKAMFPAFDSMVVNFQTNEVASRVPGPSKNPEPGWTKFYGAVPPSYGR
jgi:hypothetical protein